MDLSQATDIIYNGQSVGSVYAGSTLIWPKYIQYKENGATWNVQAPADTTGTILGHSPYTELGTSTAIDNYYTGAINKPTPFINASDIILNITYRGVTIYTMEDLIKHIINLENILQQ